MISFALFPCIYFNQKRKPVLSLFVTQESDFKVDNYSNKFSVEIQEGDSVYTHVYMYMINIKWGVLWSTVCKKFEIYPVVKDC